MGRALSRHARLGLVNAYAAWQTGITRFDACLAGIRRLPARAGASGNVTTEDLEYMLRSMGVATGVDVALLAYAARVAGWLAGRDPARHLWRAGLPTLQAQAAAGGLISGSFAQTATTINPPGIAALAAGRPAGG